MIGHVFTTSGAVCLALAPSAERSEDYIVLARFEDQYAVANVLTEKMPEADYWMRASYFDNLDGAIENFATAAGLSTDRDILHANVESAEAAIAHRHGLERPVGAPT